jgi:pyruvate dehydrogenase E2 component (dihydrolipoamide acetyltransferase)
MPSLSPTMKEGKIISWNFKVGDQVGPGDVLAEIETDKSNVGYEVQEDGYLAKIIAEQGAGSVALGAPIAIIVQNKADIAAFANYSGKASPKPAQKAPAATT